ncbi:MAG: purine-nucleoside phosphorylase [Chloroflexia bacterium]
MRTLLSGAIVLTCDEQHTVHSPGDVATDDGVISYVGPKYAGEYDERVDLSGRLLMPGLVNAHTHTPMSLFRGLADDVDLHVFLNERVWPREAKLSGDEAYAGALLSHVEMLTSGVTTCVDMYFHEDELARAALDSGIRTLITPGILEAPALAAMLGSWERRMAQVLDWCVRWKGVAGRIHTGLGPHSPYTLSLDALSDIAFEARNAELPMHIHLVETRQEREAFNARGFGSTVVALRNVRFFDSPVLVAHSVWIEDRDIEIYAAHGVGVAHCPRSNAKLGAGVAPAAAMIAAGVPVGLGTDGPATNNSLNLWNELALAPLQQRRSGSTRRCSPPRTPLGRHPARSGPPACRVWECWPRDTQPTLWRSRSITPRRRRPSTGGRGYIPMLVYAGGRELVGRWVHGKQVVRDGEVLTVDEAQVRRGTARRGRARPACDDSHSGPASHPQDGRVQRSPPLAARIERKETTRDTGNWGRSTHERLEAAAVAVRAARGETQVGLILAPASAAGRRGGDRRCAALRRHPEYSRLDRREPRRQAARRAAGGTRSTRTSGRAHLYEGYEPEDVVFGVRLLARLGVDTLIVTNAAGAINPEFNPGDPMLVTDHINLTGRNPIVGQMDARIGPRFVDMSQAYDPRLIEAAAEAAVALGEPAPHGVYLGLTGPSFETPAEIRMARVLGADAVGMSTVLEVIAARQAGMRVLGISCITNMAAGVLQQPISAQEVLETAERGTPSRR